jgi:hypothetical protein
MPKWLKFLIALLLVPACLGVATALWRVIQASGPAENVWVLLLTGAACWLVIFWLLPKPMLAYVFGHELTHVLWTWLFWGRVSRFKVSSKGGQVVVSKTNFLIALAPYFFPLYVVLVVGVFSLGNWLWDWRPYQMVFHLLVGVAYAFHLTLTWHILETDQSDVSGQGYLFSAVVIFLGNAIVLLLGLPVLTGQVSVPTALRWWLAGTLAVVQRLGRMF